MEPTRTRTVVLGDARGSERHLRVTWHPSSSTVVFSHWMGAVCTASTPVRLPEATKVIDLLVGALRELADSGDISRLPAKRRRPRFDRLWQHLGPRLADLSHLPDRIPGRITRPGHR